jgi:hypothetical protein
MKPARAINEVQETVISEITGATATATEVADLGNIVKPESVSLEIVRLEKGAITVVVATARPWLK